MFLTGQICFSYFCRESSRELSNEVLLKLAQWYRSFYLTQMFEVGQGTMTDDVLQWKPHID